MTYNKPEVTVLGDATRVIEDLFKTSGSNDAPQPNPGPAYDLDE